MFIICLFVPTVYIHNVLVYLNLLVLVFILVYTRTCMEGKYRVNYNNNFSRHWVTLYAQTTAAVYILIKP